MIPPLPTLATGPGAAGSWPNAPETKVQTLRPRVLQVFDAKYPPTGYHEPYSYIKFSDNVEDSVQYALTSNYTYLIDEDDSIWLEKNNKLARGEGSGSSPAPPSRSAVTDSRSSKARGKDPELSASFVITDDELMMGLLEKLTDKKCPFLHLVSSITWDSGICLTSLY